MPRVIHVLTGCTAVGKTELALRWAEKHGAEIVSCDSLLFYRGMDLGTAKPSPAELARVPHHLIDICDVRERMDVTRYVDLARAAIEDIFARGREVLVVGGSGFYLKVFFAPVADDVEVPESLRAELRNRLERDGLTALVKELRTLNPAGLGALDVSNPRRVLAALGRCRASGRTLVDLRTDFAAQPGPFVDFDVRLCELGRDKDDLNRRIEQRVRAMLRDGLVEEVRALAGRGLKENPSASRAIGYRETLDCLEGRLSEADLAAAIEKNTRALAKKQRTWFKTQLPAHDPVAAEGVEISALFPPARSATGK